MYKTIIFDFNGTLIDDCKLCLKILNYLCKEYNIKKVSKRKYLDIFTFPVYLYYKELGFNTNEEEFKVVGSKFHTYYNDLSYKEVKLFKNVIKVLDALKGKYTLVCLSASHQNTLEKQLKFYGIFEYFDFVVGLNDTLANSKEQVAINFANENKIKGNETLFIGDSIHDLEVANAINANCYLLSTGHTSKRRLLNETNNVITNIIKVLKIVK